MRILALESSAKACSAAILEDGEIVGETYLNCQITHSNTLLVIASQLINNTGLTVEMLDAIAVAAGPGSFTGVRIGMAAAKGLAWGKELPLYGVSTIASMARLHIGIEGIICPCMDARRNQIYNAVFESKKELKRLCQDRAVSAKVLIDELLETNEQVFLVGDGAEIVLHAFEIIPDRIHLISNPNRQEHASGVALEAYDAYLRNELSDAASLTPNYIRPSQAEREKAERLMSGI